MSENGEIYTAGNKFYTPAGTDGMDKFHLCESSVSSVSTESSEAVKQWSCDGTSFISNGIII